MEYDEYLLLEDKKDLSKKDLQEVVDDLLSLYNKDITSKLISFSHALKGFIYADEDYEQIRIYGKLEVITYDLLIYFTATFSDDMIYKVLPCINEFWTAYLKNNYKYSIFELICNHEWKTIVHEYLLNKEIIF